MPYNDGRCYASSANSNGDYALTWGRLGSSTLSLVGARISPPAQVATGFVASGTGLYVRVAASAAAAGGDHVLWSWNGVDFSIAATIPAVDIAAAGAGGWVKTTARVDGLGQDAIFLEPVPASTRVSVWPSVAPGVDAAEVSQVAGVTITARRFELSPAPGSALPAGTAITPSDSTVDWLTQLTAWDHRYSTGKWFFPVVRAGNADGVVFQDTQSHRCYLTFVGAAASVPFASSTTVELPACGASSQWYLDAATSDPGGSRIYYLLVSRTKGADETTPTTAKLVRADATTGATQLAVDLNTAKASPGLNLYKHFSAGGSLAYRASAPYEVWPSCNEGTGCTCPVDPGATNTTVYYGERALATPSAIIAGGEASYKTKVVAAGESVVCTNGEMGGDPAPNRPKHCLCAAGRTTEKDADQIAYILSRTMTRAGDGLNHQGAIAVVHGAETLALLKNHGQTSGHSFANRLGVAADQSGFLGVDLGDNYPRGIHLHRFDASSRASKVVYNFKTKHGTSATSPAGATYPPYPEISSATTSYYKWSNDNGVYTEITALLETDDAYLVLFAGERAPLDNSQVGSNINNPRNLGFIACSKDMSSSDTLSSGAEERGGFYGFNGNYFEQVNKGVVWLTSYGGANGGVGSADLSENVSRIKAARVGTNKNVVMWEVWSVTGYLRTMTMVVDDVGRVKSAPAQTQYPVRLPPADEVYVAQGGVIVLYNGVANENRLLRYEVAIDGAIIGGGAGSVGLPPGYGGGRGAGTAAGDTASNTGGGVSGAGVFFLVLFLLLLAGAAAWVFYIKKVKGAWLWEKMSAGQPLAGQRVGVVELRRYRSAARAKWKACRQKRQKGGGTSSQNGGGGSSGGGARVVDSGGTTAKSDPAVKTASAGDGDGEQQQQQQQQQQGAASGGNNDHVVVVRGPSVAKEDLCA